MTAFRPGRFQVLPVVVKNLIIINSLLVLLQFVMSGWGIDIADYLGLHYWRSHYFQPWQIFTHMFLHGSYNNVQMTVLHLFSNMFALWMFGSILENMWGPKRFLTFYIICGIGAALCHLGVLGYEFSVIDRAFEAYQQNPTVDNFARFLTQHVDSSVAARLQDFKMDWENNPSDPGFRNMSSMLINQYLHGGYHPQTHQFVGGLYDQATVGASGAVFGVLFAFGYLFPDTELYVYFLLPVKAKYFVGFYALFELYAGVRSSAGDNIAHFAHLGGMLFAFLLLRYWHRNNRRRRNIYY